MVNNLSIAASIMPLVNNNTVTMLEDLLQQAKSGELRGLIVAGFLSDGRITGGNPGVDFCGMATLIGHLQVDLMQKFIEANYVTPE